jgi:tryptophan-rich sensory protein
MKRSSVKTDAVQKGHQFDKEIFLGTYNGVAKWLTIFDSTLYGPLLPVVSFNKTQTTGPYLSSIKEICVTFLENNTHFHSSLISTYCSSIRPFFLPFRFLSLYIYFLLYISFSDFPASILSLNIRLIIFQLNCRKLNISRILQTENCSEYCPLPYILWFPLAY